jgi:hypothetical protein
MNNRTKSKGQKIKEKIKKVLQKLAQNDKHNAIEKILIKEYIIRQEIKKEINKTLNSKKLKIAKGVIILKCKNNHIEKDSGDCDILIYKNRGQKTRDGIVIVNKEDARIVISIITKSSQIKDPKYINVLSKELAKNGIEMIILLCDNTLSKTPKHLKNFNYFSLNVNEKSKENYNFDALITYLHGVLKKIR